MKPYIFCASFRCFLATILLSTFGHAAIFLSDDGREYTITLDSQQTWRDLLNNLEQMGFTPQPYETLVIVHGETDYGEGEFHQVLENDQLRESIFLLMKQGPVQRRISEDAAFLKSMREFYDNFTPAKLETWEDENGNQVIGIRFAPNRSQEPKNQETSKFFEVFRNTQNKFEK